MYGIIKPTLRFVDEQAQSDYRKSYCNLCASMSSVNNIFSRFFLAYDVVSVDWLFSVVAEERNLPFKCTNCLKGGAVGKKKKVSRYMQLLAAISGFTAGTKIQDSINDESKWRHRILAFFYRSSMKRSEVILEQYGILKKVNAFIEQNRVLEKAQCADLAQACKPTEQAYQLMTNVIAEHYKIDKSYAVTLGQYFGRCVYLCDALKDMSEDKKNHQYNVLNNLAVADEASRTKICFIRCMEHIKPLKAQLLTELETQAADSKARWLNIIMTIDTQFAQLAATYKIDNVKPYLMGFGEEKQILHSCDGMFGACKICCPCPGGDADKAKKGCGC